MGFLHWTGRGGRAALLLAAGAAGGGAAIAVASVPDSSGVIHACLQLTRNAVGQTVPDQSAPNLTVIDTDAGQRCVPPDPPVPNQTELTWNVAGQPGPPGTNGTNGAAGPQGAPGTGNTYTITLPPITGNSSSFGEVTLVPDRGSKLTFPILGLSTLGKTTSGTGSGAGAGKVTHAPFTITKLIDSASPKLYFASSNGTHYKNATITVKKSGKPYLKYTLNNVLVSSIQQGPQGGGGSRPKESVTLVYGSIKIQYTPQTHTKKK
jgi:type VI secretion system Hcp family effector